MQLDVEEFLDKYNLRTTPDVRFIDVVSEIGELGKEILKGNDYGKKAHQNSPKLKASESCRIMLDIDSSLCDVCGNAPMQGVS